MEPGIYTDVPRDQYDEWPYLNGSTLSKAIQQDGVTISMKHLRAHLDGRIEEKQSRDAAFGSAIHTRLLEPDRFEQRHPVAGQCQAILKFGARKGEQCISQATVRHESLWYCGQHAPVGAEEPDGTITSREAERIEELAAEIRNHPVVKLFRASGGVETSVVWDQDVPFWHDGQERHTTIRMKGRVDKLIGEKLIVDLKKVQVGQHTDEAFGRAILKWHYHLKAALYQDGFAAADGHVRPFCWCVVEDGPPYDVNPIQAKPEDLELGRRLYRDVLTRYATCDHTGVWPGVASEIHSGGLPEWFLRRTAE